MGYDAGGHPIEPAAGARKYRKKTGPLGGQKSVDPPGAAVTMLRVLVRVDQSHVCRQRVRQLTAMKRLTMRPCVGLFQFVALCAILIVGVPRVPEPQPHIIPQPT